MEYSKAKLVSKVIAHLLLLDHNESENHQAETGLYDLYYKRILTLNNEKSFALLSPSRGTTEWHGYFGISDLPSSRVQYTATLTITVHKLTHHKWLLLLFNDDHVLKLRSETVAVRRRMIRGLDDM